MGQAKLRSKEIKELKTKGPKVKAQINGYRPDAGLNSAEDTNYYWLQVTELIQAMSGNGMRSYTYQGERWLEINTPVDIMDEAGIVQKAPKHEKGYFATIRFTPELLEEFAEQIAKGAMSVRVTGVPKETSTSPFGEKFRIIQATDSWSAGNNSGLMAYMVMMNDGIVNTDSQAISRRYKEIANNMRLMPL
jgi:hypothetical protein